MARQQGPIGRHSYLGPTIQDGTLARQVTPSPGPVGTDDRIAAWSVKHKLLSAAERTTNKLPVEMRAEFAALFTKEYAYITGGVLAAWAASHAVGVGEAADAILLGVGVVTLGVQAFQGGRELGKFLLTAANARTEDDLEAASRHLASAVITLGVATLTALIMRSRPNVGGAAAATEDALAARVEAGQILEMIGLKSKPAGVRDMVTAFVKFADTEMPELSLAQKANFVKAMDLSKFAEAGEETLRPGTRLVAKVQGQAGKPGNWFTKVGTSNEQVGISSGSGAATRVQKVYVVKSPIKVFRSRAASTVDTWSEGRSPQVMVGTRPGVAKYGEYVGGGGTQFLIGDWAGLTPE